MSSIQLGDKQITLEDVDTILIDHTPVLVNDAYLAKVSVG